MEEIMKAIEEKNCEKLRRILYYKVDDLSDEELKEVLEKAEKLAKECKDWELYKLVLYYYHEILNEDKISEFEKLAKESDDFELKFHLADLYYLIGELEKSLELFRALLEEEVAKGNIEHAARIYYSMAMIHEELQEYEKALELIEKAEELYRELGDERELLRIEIHRGYITFEAGDTYKGKAIIAGVLPKVLNDNELLVEAHLSFEEIFEEEENYDAALQECLYALIRAKGTDYEDIAFGSLMDVLWQLFLDDDFETVYLNIDMFINAFPDMKDFFEAVKALALFKDGKIDEEDAKKAIEKVKDPRLLEMLEFLGEAEL
ncbi:tetratricopeptide repeat protein [Thermococcus sp. 9N3]|uniref:tetratricopeptide repeat protein n=2 Tax=unclassified Thermococcus TaxID=2627626 RepID=UPI001432225C|nr:tetratricopeptide repeat protein [Thermococcus sp. 9N3]NJE48975.1 tetratricopeptide repeat protein [Thermococcus sp. 9N3]